MRQVKHPWKGWTADEDKYLRANAGLVDADTLCSVLGRSIRSIYNYQSRMGIRCYDRCYSMPAIAKVLAVSIGKVSWWVYTGQLSGSVTAPRAWKNGTKTKMILEEDILKFLKTYRPQLNPRKIHNKGFATLAQWSLKNPLLTLVDLQRLDLAKEDGNYSHRGRHWGKKRGCIVCKLNHREVDNDTKMCETCTDGLFSAPAVPTESAKADTVEQWADQMNAEYTTLIDEQRRLDERKEQDEQTEKADQVSQSVCDILPANKGCEHGADNCLLCPVPGGCYFELSTTARRAWDDSRLVAQTL